MSSLLSLFNLYNDREVGASLKIHREIYTLVICYFNNDNDKAQKNKLVGNEPFLMSLGLLERKLSKDEIKIESILNLRKFYLKTQ